MAISAATAAAGLQGAGSIMGALGGGKSQQTAQQISGFESLPDDVKDYLTGDIFGRIQAYGETPFPTVPYRRADEREMDPIFGSRALRELQMLKDYQTGVYGNGPAMQNAAQGPSAAEQQAALNDLRDEMLGREFLQGLKGQKGYASAVPSNYSAEDLALFGKLSGGQAGHAGLMQAQRSGGDEYSKFLEALTRGRV